MSIRRRIAVAATALGTVAAGLVSGVVSGATLSTADASTTTATGQTVEVFVKRDNTVRMPTTIQPGVTTFKVTSVRAAAFQIVQAAPGYTKRAAMHDISVAFSVNNVRALKRFESKVTLLGGLPSTPRQAATFATRLRPGTYWALDSRPMKLDAAKVLTFEVKGEGLGGKLSGHIIRATGDAEWGKLSGRIPRRGQILFQNRSTDNHFLEIAKLAKGKTMRDFRAWMEELKQGNETPPPVDFANSIDSGVISGGKAMSLDYRLPAGRYVILCWWSDADMGGMPHAFMGMYRGLRVG